MPEDNRTLAAAVADTVVVSSDEFAAASAPIFWQWSRALAAPVLESLNEITEADATVPRMLAEVLGDPGNPLTRRAFIDQLCMFARRCPARTSELFEHAWSAECNSRIGYHLGDRYTPTQPVVGLDDLCMSPTRSAGPGPEGAAVLVVVPFRDATSHRGRARNLMACLHALNNQSAARTTYHIAVVETDETPRWGDVLAGHCDSYTFARNNRPFNKSWAVNVGVRNTPGDYDLVCILDADVLPDHDFIARNIRRFRQAGSQAVLPYRDAVFLDPPATDLAIIEQVFGDRPGVSWEHSRGFCVRRNPGLCFWIRRTVFAAIGGMDERFEGWGGEDTDFALRVSARAALDRYDDPIVHQFHVPSSTRPDGTVPNAHVVRMSWPSDSDFGILDKFAQE